MLHIFNRNYNTDNFDIPTSRKYRRNTAKEFNNMYINIIQLKEDITF